MSGRIVVVGSVNVDYVLTTPRIPKAGETLAGDRFAIHGGGKGANQALACARLGGSTSLIACVGDDNAGRERLIELSESGINTTPVQSVPKTSTGSAVIFVADDGENCIGICAGANNALDTKAVDAHSALIRDAQILLVQLETPDSGINTALETAHAAGLTVILDPAPARVLSDRTLSLVSILTPNQTEASALSGMPCDTEEHARAVSEHLRSKGPETVVITMGEHGALVNHQGDIVRCPAASAGHVVDTVAAGDTFAGALAVGLAEERPLMEAVLFANRAAAISVTRHGAGPSIPHRHEVEALEPD
ncbi:MAG: ribokinase [Pseudomonadota bacterium]